MRSAKQRANDRRLGRMAKKRFSTKRKASSTRTKRSKPMARRRSSTRRRSVSRTVRRVASRRTGSKIISTVKPMASGIGGGILMETVASRVGMGQYGSIAGFGGAYLFGGVKGVLGKLGFDLISGRGFSLGGLGGQQNTSMVGMQI
mgnify:FL=1|tara:strand:+ start:398 stop:835 length:438 start_codon:yes stop_codon:yes gene_type:complete